MIKVLILCNDFPPLNSISAQRTFFWFRNLSKYGIQPTVIARKWKEGLTNVADCYQSDQDGEIIEIKPWGTLIRVPYTANKSDAIKSNHNNSLLRKGYTALELILKWFFKSFDENYFLFERAYRYIREEKIDLIIVSAQPFILFRYAWKLNKSFKIPWIADYRDGWSTNHVAYRGFFRNLLKPFDRILEKKYLKTASLFTSVSKGLVDRISNVITPEGFVVENGVDHEKIRGLTGINSLKGKFCIVYTGRIYSEQNVGMFIHAFRTLLNEPNDEVLLIMVGARFLSNVHYVALEALQKDFPSHVLLTDTVSHEMSLRYQLSASLLLKFNMAAQIDGFYGGKLYEYAATGIPILTVLNDDNKETNFFPGRDIQQFASNETEIIDIIKTKLSIFRKGESLSTSITSEEVFAISREYQTSLFANKIQSLLK